MALTQLALSIPFFLAVSPHVVSAFIPGYTRFETIEITTSLFSAKEKIMGDMDVMCIANAAELCTLYDECNIEEREALLNRFEEQTDVLAERLAMMKVLTKHLETGEKTNTVEEMTFLKSEILTMVEGDDFSQEAIASAEFLDGSSVDDLKDEIMTAIQDDNHDMESKSEFITAMLEDTNNGNNYDAWLGF